MTPMASATATSLPYVTELVAMLFPAAVPLMQTVQKKWCKRKGPSQRRSLPQEATRSGEILLCQA